MASIFDLKGATLTLSDGAATPHTLAVKLGDGSFSWTEKKNMEYKKDRGKLDTVMEGDEEPVDLKFDFNWTFIKGDGTVTIEDFLKKINGASAYTSSDADTCAPYAVDLILAYTPRHCTTEKIETITFADFRYEQLDHDAKGATISCSGKCNITAPTSVRTAQS